MNEIGERLLRIISESLPKLPLVARMPIDDKGVDRVNFITREFQIPADMAEPAMSDDFLRHCGEVAEAHGCSFRRGGDGSLFFRKPAEAP
jgi:hypothetical protein